MSNSQLYSLAWPMAAVLLNVKAVGLTFNLYQLVQKGYRLSNLLSLFCDDQAELNSHCSHAVPSHGQFYAHPRHSHIVLIHDQALILD